MTKESIANEIYDFIDGMGHGVSFVEIVERFGSGEQSIHHPKWRNVVIWYDMPEQSVTGIMELLEDERIVLVPTNPMLYVIDGKIPNLPIVRRHPKNGYKEIHWLPMSISTVPQWKKWEAIKHNEVV